MINNNLCELSYNNCKKQCGYVKEYYKSIYNKLIDYFSYDKNVTEPLLSKYKCNNCNIEFISENVLNEHQNMCNNIDYCETTGEKYYDISDSSLFKKSYTCEKCDIIFSHKNGYEEHLKYCYKSIYGNLI